MIERLIHQEGVWFAPNRATKYVKQKLIELKGDIDKSTTRHFNTPLSGALEQLDRKPTRI